MPARKVNLGLSDETASALANATPEGKALLKSVQDERAALAMERSNFEEQKRREAAAFDAERLALATERNVFETKKADAESDLEEREKVIAESEVALDVRASALDEREKELNARAEGLKDTEDGMARSLDAIRGLRDFLNRENI